MNLKVYNSKGIQVGDTQRKMNNIFTAVGHFNVDTYKLALNPGKYNVVMSYDGNTEQNINPCEASCTLTVTS